MQGKSHSSRIPGVVAGLMLGILISAMDNAIVATSMGAIVSDLGGMEKFAWATSAYMIASMTGTPIFGKLSDMYGRKRFFVFGLSVFLIGSILCGMAGSMTQLCAFRAIQGIGGGAITPIAITILFDIFPIEKRGKVSGITGAVFGASSLSGPMLGAVVTDHLGWHWIFYLNVPIGAAACLLTVMCYEETFAKTKQKIDWFGATTLIGAIVSLMFALELGGQTYAWDSAVIVALLLACAVLLGVFVLAETRAEAPIVSFAMFRNRLFAASNSAAFFYGAGFALTTVYIPIFIQGVYGGTATNSGLILMPMLITGVAFSQLGARLTSWMSYRSLMTASALLYLAGIAALATLSPDKDRWIVTSFMIVTGMGVGISMSVLSQSAIHSFDSSRRGAATSSVMFLRSLGMTLGLTVFGILQRNEFASSLSKAFGGTGNMPQGLDSSSALTPERRAELPSQILQKIADALSSSISRMFLWAIVPAVLALLIVLAMSRERAVTPIRRAGEGKGR